MAKAQAFPKVKTIGTIVGFGKKKGCCDFKLAGVKITGTQFEKLGDMIDEGDPVDITLQKRQATMAAVKETGSAASIPFEED
jgi:hypothetical protein